ncbi:MAG: hypothetical protein QG632_571 [Candidatus Dependentiae bacterium]|nr:hypothetical protein [Candidatus Dependentiae bacterium]
MLKEALLISLLLGSGFAVVKGPFFKGKFASKNHNFPSRCFHEVRRLLIYFYRSHVDYAPQVKTNADILEHFHVAHDFFSRKELPSPLLKEQVLTEIAKILQYQEEADPLVNALAKGCYEISESALSALMKIRDWLAAEEKKQTLA